MTDQMNEVHRTLGRIEGKQDQILAVQTTLSSKQDKQEKDIQGLRASQHRYAGGLGALFAVLVFAKDKISGIFFG
jgi:hypothetical protein